MSGTDKDSVRVAAGYLGTEKQWSVFEEQWALALQAAGVKQFHATDFFSFRGEFTGWDQDIRRHVKFAKRFTAIAETRTEFGIGRAIEPAAFARILTPILHRYPPIKSGRFTSPTHCGLALLGGAVNLGIPRGKQIVAVFEQEDGIGLIIDYFNYLKRKGTAWTEMFASITAAPKEQFLPLQGADLLAHEAWRQSKDYLCPSGRGLRRSFRCLFVRGRLQIRIATEGNMR